MKARCAMAVMFSVVFAAEVFAGDTNDPVRAAADGRALAQQLLSLRPDASFTNTGKLIIRAPKQKRREVDYVCRVVVTATNWTSFYSAKQNTNALLGYSVEHRDGAANIYRDDGQTLLTPTQTFAAFAGSDFSLADLGLEFLHWPNQRVLKWEMKRSFGCNVLESKNPETQAGGYSRIVSWIHQETGGLIQAEAYDARGKKLKEFRPTEVEKVNGRQELKEMEIENVQTDSRTTLIFNL